MGILFLKSSAGMCCLCNSKEKLTREHKLKASELRKVFSNNEMRVGVGGTSKFKIAQSIKSQALQFEPQLCVACNSARSQNADIEFEKLNDITQQYISQNRDPNEVFNEPRYQKGTEIYFNAFRYFAKILCCHIAQDHGPSPRRLAHFSISKGTHNPVWLKIQKDHAYEISVQDIGEHNYAAHGGLAVWADENTLNPTAFYSSISFGPVQYTFWMRLAKLEQLELKYLHRRYYEFCRTKVMEAISDPISDEDRKRLGF